jgi:S-adenosylmethionine-diacylglycerol 3-amino-3-carboxypropyl transferase
MTAPVPLGSSETAATIADGSLRYSTVWEDYRLLDLGLALDRTSDLLVIAGAGCNVLNLLLRAPRRLVALDFNPAQMALVELKLAAIRALPYDDFAALIGVRPSNRRPELYERLRPSMGAAARAWWDANLATLANGVEQAGRLDRYIAEFRERHLSRVHEPEVVDRLFTLDDPTARRRFAEEEFFTPAFESVFRGYFTRESIGAHGRDGSQFRYVDNVDVGEWFWRRLQRVVLELPTRGNFYLERFLRGGVRDARVGPPYLHRHNYGRLRALVSRVDVVNDSLEHYLAAAPRASLDGAALSDVFEYMSADAADEVFHRVSEVVRPGRRLCFWNLLVPREPSRRFTRLQPLRALSHVLWQRDRSWFYRAFHVVEVLS